MRINLFIGEKAREAGWSYTCSGKAGGIIPVYNKSGQQVCTLQETPTGRKTLICTPVRHQQLTEGEDVVAAVEINLLHTRLGHANERVLKNLAREHLVRGLEGGISRVLQNCEGCKMGKAHDKPHPRREAGAGEQVCLGRVSVDLAGPFNPASIGGGVYNMVLVGEYN